MKTTMTTRTAGERLVHFPAGARNRTSTVEMPLTRPSATLSRPTLSVSHRSFC